MKKSTKHTILWSVLILYLIGMIIFISVRRSEIICKSIEVQITDSSKNDFIDKQEISSLLNRNKLKYLNMPMEVVNAAEIERVVNTHPSIRKAEVVKRIDGILVIKVSQRIPLMRVIVNEKTQYYIDQDGKVIPVSDKYAARVPIANGNIPAFNRKLAVADRLTPSQLDSGLFMLPCVGNPERCIWHDLFYIGKFIQNNSFWNSLISQIYVRPNGDFELIPIMGCQSILFGDMEDYEEKFRKIRSMYQDGFHRVGWDTYTMINVKFKDQVVCTKR